MKDVLIIGAGPVGLFSAFQCGMHDLSCHIVDALSEVGGQCAALYPEKPIYDVPGHPYILAQDLIRNLIEQMTPFSPEITLGETIEQLEEVEHGLLAISSSGKKIYAKTVIIAAGVGSFQAKRLPLDGIESFEGKSIFYSVAQKDLFLGKRVVIAGGGDSACDWALELSDRASTIELIHRRDVFRTSPHTLNALKAKENVVFRVPYTLKNIEGVNGILSHVIVEDFSGSCLKLDADYLLAFFGLSVSLGSMERWGMEMHKNQIVIDPLTAQTSKKMIYAVGDVATYSHKQKLILTGFSEAAQAAFNIRKCLRPEKTFHFEHSTSKFSGRHFTTNKAHTSIHKTT